VGEENYELLEDCGRGVSATVRMKARGRYNEDIITLCLLVISGFLLQLEDCWKG